MRAECAAKLSGGYAAVSSDAVWKPVERVFNKIRQCRPRATRDDTLAANCVAFIKPASIGLWIQDL
jgi:transposase